MPTNNPIDNLVHDMWADRVTACTVADEDTHLYDPARNPDAKNLYMLGMRDLITAMDNWTVAKIDSEIVGQLLQGVHRATDPSAQGVAPRQAHQSQH